MRNESDAVSQHFDRFGVAQVDAFVHHIAAVRAHHADHGGQQCLMLFAILRVHKHRMRGACMERQRQVVKNIAAGLAIGHGHMIERECRIRFEEERILFAIALDFIVEL